MKAFKDGDAVCITLNDFINLQESPAVFVGGDLAHNIERAGFDLGRVFNDELGAVIARLIVGDESAAVQVTPKDLPLYQVYFVLHDEYLARFASVIDKAESLGDSTTACWSRITADVDFGDFFRKGSVSVDCEFIHDDYRVGDCVVFRILETNKR